MGLWDSAKAAVKSVVTTEENPYAGITYEASPLHTLILALITGINSFQKKNIENFKDENEQKTMEDIEQGKKILQVLHEKVLPSLDEGKNLELGIVTLKKFANIFLTATDLKNALSIASKAVIPLSGVSIEDGISQIKSMIIDTIKKNTLIELFLESLGDEHEIDYMLYKINQNTVLKKALPDLILILINFKKFSLTELVPFLNPNIFVSESLNITQVDVNASQFIYFRNNEKIDIEEIYKRFVDELAKKIDDNSQAVALSPTQATLTTTVDISKQEFILFPSEHAEQSSEAEPEKQQSSSDSLSVKEELQQESERSELEKIIKGNAIQIQTVVKETKDETSEEVNVIEPEQNLSDKEEIFLESSDTSSSEEHSQVLSAESTKHTQSSTVEQPDVSVENPASEEIQVSKAEPEEQQSSDDSLIVKVEEPISEEPEQSDSAQVIEANAKKIQTINQEKADLEKELLKWQSIRGHIEKNVLNNDVSTKFLDDEKLINKVLMLNDENLKKLYENAKVEAKKFFTKDMPARQNFVKKLKELLNKKIEELNQQLAEHQETLKNIQNACRQLLVQEQLEKTQQTLYALQKKSLQEIVTEIANIDLSAIDNSHPENQALFESLSTRLDTIEARLKVWNKIATISDQDKKDDIEQALEVLKEDEVHLPAVLKSENLQAMYNERLKLIELDNALDALKDLEIEAIVEQFKQIENDLPENAMDINQKLYEKVKAQFYLINNYLTCYQALQAQQEQLTSIQEEQSIETIAEAIREIVLPAVDDNSHPENKALLGSLSTRLDTMKARLKVWNKIANISGQGEKDDIEQALEVLKEDEVHLPAVLQSTNLQDMYNERLQLLELDNALDALKDLEVEAIIQEFDKIKDKLPKSAMDINQALYEKVKAQFDLINNHLICYQELQEQLTSIQEEQSIETIAEAIRKIVLPAVNNSHPEDQALFKSLSTRLNNINARLEVWNKIATISDQDKKDDIEQALEVLKEDEVHLPAVLQSTNLQDMYNERLQLLELDNALDALKDLEVEAIIQEFDKIKDKLPKSAMDINQAFYEKVKARFTAIKERLKFHTSTTLSIADIPWKTLEEELKALSSDHDASLPDKLGKQNLTTQLNKQKNYVNSIHYWQNKLLECQQKSKQQATGSLTQELRDLFPEYFSKEGIEQALNTINGKNINASSGYFGRAILGGLQADCMKFSRDGTFITREKLIDDNKINDVKQMPGFPTLDKKSDYYSVLAKITELADYGQQKGYSQTAQLAYDLGECLSALHQAESAEVPDEKQVQALKNEFNLRLHSRDDIMHKHKQVWKPLLLAAVTAGLSVAVKLISTGFRQCFFDTNRQKQLHAIDTSFERVAKSAPTA